MEGGLLYCCHNFLYLQPTVRQHHGGSSKLLNDHCSVTHLLHFQDHRMKSHHSLSAPLLCHFFFFFFPFLGNLTFIALVCPQGEPFESSCLEISHYSRRKMQFYWSYGNRRIHMHVTADVFFYHRRRQTVSRNGWIFYNLFENSADFGPSMSIDFCSNFSLVIVFPVTCLLICNKSPTADKLAAKPHFVLHVE